MLRTTMVCSTAVTVGNSVAKDRQVPEERRKSTFRRLASTRGLNKSICKDSAEVAPEIQKSGWVRIYSGPEPFADMKSQLLYLNRDTTVKTVTKKLAMPPNLTIWIQFGGGQTRRLSEDDCPLEIQDDFLIKLGYDDLSRRSRMGIDPELRFLIRLHGGPASPSTRLPGIPRSAPLQVLKGLVFPNWKRRPIAVVDSKLLLYPGTSKESYFFSNL